MDKNSDEKPENSEGMAKESTSSLNPEESAKVEVEDSFSYGDENNLKEEKTAYGLMKPRLLEQEMQESYLDYAMSVIVARALPDVRDGLKPVHRRVLYSMYELGLTHAAKYRKSATVVGDVLGKYHPHGDLAVYDTLVRLAQNFSMRTPLVDGQGNFGSMDGDTPAAMRYTEVRMAAPAEELLSDIEKNTVDFVANYDSTRNEPKVLPAKLPNLLVNGSMGIAVGMATNIPPHNLGELADAISYLIDNPDCTIDDLMKFIKGPDFPTGAEIWGTEQIKTAYVTGKGSIVMRAVASIEETKRGAFRIIVSEIPYQVNKAELIIKIADLVRVKKIEGISNLRDESDRKEGVRIVIDLKANCYPKKILNRLYELTSMQESFHVNMLALVDGIQPRVLTLKSILAEYIKHRQQVIRRRTQFDLKRAKERAHILEGLKIALKNIDEVISEIKKSKNREEAHKNLQSKFKLSSEQANAILEMKLSALAALERQRVEDEYKEKIELIKELEAVLNDEHKILNIIKKELLEVKKKFESSRRTKIYEQALDKFKAEDLIPSEQVVIILTKGNYIKRMPATSYRSQTRGGKGIVGMETKEEDIIEHLIAADTHDDIMFFTDRGRIFQTKVYEIPTSSRLAKGQAIVNILQISPEEKVTAVVTLSGKDKEKLKYFVMATEKGVVKKAALELYKNVRKTGILALKLNQGDKLKWVKTTTGQDNIFQVSSKGQSIYYQEENIRPMGRSAAGVRGIALRSGDFVVDVDVIPREMEAEANALIVLENGFGKRTPLKMFKKQLRGGFGIRAANVTSRTGQIIGAEIIFSDDYDVILASKHGQMIRCAIRSIKRLQRDTQGVTLMKMHENDKVASVTVVRKTEVPVVQKKDEGRGKETPEVAVPEKEDRPIEEAPDVEKIVKEEVKKGEEVKREIAHEVELTKDDEKKVQDWALAHKDSWRQPTIYKLDKDIKVHDYKDEAKKKKETKQDNLFGDKKDSKISSPKPKNSEPNYWGKPK